MKLTLQGGQENKTTYNLEDGVVIVTMYPFPLAAFNRNIWEARDTIDTIFGREASLALRSLLCVAAVDNSLFTAGGEWCGEAWHISCEVQANLRVSPDPSSIPCAR
jgi:hypothetical protein